MTPAPESPPASQPSPAAEAVGNGRYVVVATLGAGAQGETLEAVDKREGRAVAIKRFTIRGAKSWKDVELAEREASVLASLDHPNLPRYIDHFEENGALYLVMDKVEGESLAARRRRGQALNPEQVRRFLEDAAECLRYLHGHAPPIVHRDIKPGNVILRPDGSYCLVDFGSVRDRLKPEGGSTVVGTFGFMAPEQFQGRAAPGSDVYAVGATAIALITGREPEDLPHKGLGIDVESALRGQVDRRLVSALRSMLEPDPDRRTSSVDAVLRSAGLRDLPGPASSRSAEALRNARRARLEAEALRSRVRDDVEQTIRDETERYRERSEHHHRRQEQKRAERDARRARKAAERAARRAQRHGHRAADAGWHGRKHPVPPAIVLGIVLLLGLRVASVATFALFHVLLPLLFSILGNSERRERMHEIGAAGLQGLQRAREHIRQQFLAGRRRESSGGFTRGAEAAPFEAQQSKPRQRVSIDAEAEEVEEQSDEEEKRARR